MTKLKFILPTISVIALLTSCISTKKLLLPHTDQSTMSIEKRINGVYQNIDTTANTGTTSLINIVCEKRKIKFPENQQDLLIHLELQDNKIFVKGLIRDSLVYEGEIWGKIKEDRFISKRKFIFLPLLLFYLQKESRQLIYLDENGMLHATNRGYLYWIVITGRNLNYSDIYQRYGQFKKVDELPNPFM